MKDPTPPEERPGVIYKIRCICGDFYVGETKRTLATGLRLHADSEHLKDPQLPSTHCRRAMRSIGTTWRSLIATARDLQERKAKESLYIRMAPMTCLMNRDEGRELLLLWLGIPSHMDPTL